MKLKELSVIHIFGGGFLLICVLCMGIVSILDEEPERYEEIRYETRHRRVNMIIKPLPEYTSGRPLLDALIQAEDDLLDRAPPDTEGWTVMAVYDERTVFDDGSMSQIGSAIKVPADEMTRYQWTVDPRWLHAVAARDLDIFHDFWSSLWAAGCVGEDGCEAQVKAGVAERFGVDRDEVDASLLAANLIGCPGDHCSKRIGRR